MNRTNSEIRDEILKRKRELDARDSRRRKSISFCLTAVVCCIAVIALRGDKPTPAEKESSVNSENTVSVEKETTLNREENQGNENDGETSKVENQISNIQGLFIPAYVIFDYRLYATSSGRFYEKKEISDKIDKEFFLITNDGFESKYYSLKGESVEKKILLPYQGMYYIGCDFICDGIVDINGNKYGIVNDRHISWYCTSDPEVGKMIGTFDGKAVYEFVSDSEKVLIDFSSEFENNKEDSLLVAELIK